jgi:AraC-like DNA-binding protein
MPQGRTSVDEELLARHRVLDTDSEDERASFQNRTGGAHLVLVEPSSQPRRYVVNHARLSGWDLAWSFRMAPRTRLTVPAGTSWFLLHLNLAGTVIYEIRGRRIRLAPGDGLLLAPGLPYTSESEAGESRTLALRLSAAQLRSGPRPGRRPQALAETPIDAGAFASLRRALLFAASELDEPSSSLATSPSCQRDMLALVVGRLRDAFEVSRRPWPIDLPVRTAGADRLRPVADWIEANLHGPVTLSQLAGIAGVSTRTLQQDFQRVHECTPLAFLRQRRLERAQLLLSRARPGTSVTEVAGSCGFTHLGRFSVAYRRLFGESPSAALAGSPRRAAEDGLRRPGARAPSPPAG